jgi:hypothetical protein
VNTVPQLGRQVSTAAGAIMALPKFILGYSKQSKKWELTDGKKAVVKRFKNKADALKGGVLSKAVKGKGSVRIRKLNGQI